MFPLQDYDLDASAEIVITDADNASISDTITLDLSPDNEAPTATNMDQTLEFDEDSTDNALTAIVITEVDTIQASTDLTTASDDASAETVSVTITLSDITAGSFSVDSGSGESFSAGVWSISNVSVTTANTALAALNIHLLQTMIWMLLLLLSLQMPMVNRLKMISYWISHQPMKHLF